MSLLTRFQGPSRLVALVWLGALALACGATHSPEEGPELARRAFESRAPQYRAGAALATGLQHSCAVLADGTVRCWGENSDGQLGNDTVMDSSTPVSPSGLSTVISVAAGGNHTCALRSDGTVRCWGENDYGQLGDSTTAPAHVPVAVNNVTNAVAIALGEYHSCALIADGTVRCWGDNISGQLGDGTINSRSTAAPVSALSNAIAIAAYSYQTCALISGGTMRCWGDNTNGQLGDGTRTTPRTTPVSVGGLGYVTAISVGLDHTCALIEDGTLRCWGGNTIGQLGDGNTNVYALTPVTVSGLSDVVNLTAGDFRTCAILGDGTARCWGYASAGALGDGTNGSSPTPVTVSGLGNAVAISTASGHTCAILSSGSVSCWGSGYAGQLGNGYTSSSTTPVAVSGISNALGGARLATGAYHTCAARADGTVACWGHNMYGQLGDNSEIQRESPVTVSGLSNVAALTAGQWHTCALLGDGTAKCWGRDIYGGLGNGSSGDSSTPMPVSGLSNAVALSAGRYHTCALRGDGTVMCWGRNTNGECGNGTPGGYLQVPVQVTGIPDSGGARAIAIAAGGDHTCALLTDGKVRCWGDNTSGQLGDGTTDPHVTPAVVSLLVKAVAITANQKHTCAVTASGAAYCWGDDSRGQVGDGAGSSGIVTRPVVVSGLSGAVTITAGYLHTCATTAAGGARCWGYNYRGQLGDMTNDDRYVPATVQGAVVLMGTTVLPLSSAVTIDAGEHHTCAMRSNGTVRCWGYNQYGQLGDGSNDSSNMPVTVVGFP